MHRGKFPPASDTGPAIGVQRDGPDRCAAVFEGDAARGRGRSANGGGERHRLAGSHQGRRRGQRDRWSDGIDRLRCRPRGAGVDGLEVGVAAVRRNDRVVARPASAGEREARLVDAINDLEGDRGLALPAVDREGDKTGGRARAQTRRYRRRECHRLAEARTSRGR